ncbi:phospholipase D family protein [Aestuariicella sp. G3-2]|uniref:phospholipase D family protein n=1 Tax=Pseudomaricurvus albidus TaxID=2842452 RepID=UPI001C0B8424|nr:phospholipase D family protein [Aestuariicella albida]MBU3068877.1 phospholipase D family protein [Aestuariicella albida]
MKLADRSGIEKTTKIIDVQETALSRRVRHHTDQYPGQSGVYPLVSGKDALDARLALIAAAEKTLDLQYYIWHRDQTGKLLSSCLLDAADRGVRVRLLLDDVGSPIGDERLLLLSQHVNIDIRLFNPLLSRVRRLWSMVWNYGRANRRMHNKSLTADNTVTLVGGRNIGNEYFEAGGQVDFADLDIMAIGPVVDQASDGFDEYWNSDISCPIELISHKKFTVKELASANRNYREHFRKYTHSSWIDDFLKIDDAPSITSDHGESQINPDGHSDADIATKWYWSQASIMYDHPDKVLGRGFGKFKSLSSQLAELSNSVSQELLLVSPYFIPGRAGLEYFSLLRSRGVNITILTNSLAATDVGAVHSGYAKYRKRLLKMGVAIYEARSEQDVLSQKPRLRKRIRRWAFRRKNRADHTMPITRSARASLHAKAFFIDQQRTFVGSMNLDPRSLLINTEIGVLVDNPEMTREAVDDIMMSLPGNSYQLALDKGNKLVWILHRDDGDVRFYSEPQATVFQRVAVWLMARFPIESQL